jgi:hypothetical protein
MNKMFIVLGVMVLLLVGSVSGYYCNKPTPYSFDNYNEVHEWKEAEHPKVKTIISKEDYNKVFEDYRSGILTKQEAAHKLKGVSFE